MRLDTLVWLRWHAIVGQTTGVLVVYFGLDFQLPIWACLGVIALLVDRVRREYIQRIYELCGRNV